MRLLGLLVALFIALIGLTGVFAPDCLVTIGQYSVTSVGIYVAAALRIGIGLVLARVAPVSRAPKTLRIFGVIAVIAGVTTLFLWDRTCAGYPGMVVGAGTCVHTFVGRSPPGPGRFHRVRSRPKEPRCLITG